MIIIDPTSPTPPFEQLRTQYVAAIASGELPPGSRLPTVRRLAGDLGLAPGTVARAYRELETTGLIETRGRHGTFVSVDENAALGQVQRAAAAFAEQVRGLRVDTDQALAAVIAALKTTEPDELPV
ncbi:MULTISPECIES: GntR family transcriptional regulator [Microbacterium]|jgi:DNA-binding transcriptional regulator YhcF (GntR family)|uniref:GntR family transcriptional regulator n=1 Tax=Microbacterium schleiferi TaxID=69362 RepID=A0ABU7V607_9MICO|nr:GntR family transcriptional regulator [Microbacterium sp. 67-17]MBD3753312.1 GntR family transcriptional regulator [Micrococcales bacterium]OJW01400.1 MAG: GntR family transcriptional regulator [Microbacterium sp. 67-17]